LTYNVQLFRATYAMEYDARIRRALIATWKIHLPLAARIALVPLDFV